MAYAKLIFAFVLMSLLQGCVIDGLVKHEKEYIYITKYQLVEPSSDMIRACELAPQPPEPSVYAAMTAEQKEKALHDYASLEQKAMKNCNIRLSKLPEWYAKQRKLYEQANQDEENSKKK